MVVFVPVHSEHFSKKKIQLPQKLNGKKCHFNKLNIESNAHNESLLMISDRWYLNKLFVFLNVNDVLSGGAIRWNPLLDDLSIRCEFMFIMSMESKNYQSITVLFIGLHLDIVKKQIERK